jgi:hypothetical protein
MALGDEQYKEEGVFKRLGNLFQSNIIIRKTPTGRLRVKNLDMTQTALSSNFIDRYQRLMGSSHMSTYAAKQNAKNAYDIARKELFRDYELMDTDPIISSALDVYSDESTVDNVEGAIIKIKTDNPKVQTILENLFTSILNIEFNLWSWIRNLTKYGDFFLKLEILDKYGVVNIKPLSVYEVIRLEDHDPGDPKLVQFEVEDSSQINTQPELLENYEVAHFRLMSDANFLPYGKSTLEGARKVWKQLTLMEDAMLIHRIMRAPEKRVFKLDIGNIPPNEVENFMQQIINKMKKIPVIDQSTGEYNLRYNIESVTEDYFLPVRGGDSGTSIEALQGLENAGAIDDIEYLRNKMMAALKIPKAFLGYEEGVGSKATLAAEDVRFSRTIERLQKIICAELEKIAIIHLYTQGFEDAELINFELELTNPSMIHEQEKLELLTQQIEVAQSIMENKLFSREWIYDNIFELNESDKKEVFKEIIEDLKQQFRFEQIAMEGNDPAVTGEKDNSSAEAGGSSDSMFGEGSGEWGGSEKGRFKRPVNPHGAKQKDLADATSYHRERQGKREFKGKSPLATSKGSTLVKREGLMNKLKEKFGKDVKNKSILSEEAILDE